MSMSIDDLRKQEHVALQEMYEVMRAYKIVNEQVEEAKKAGEECGVLEAAEAFVIKQLEKSVEKHVLSKVALRQLLAKKQRAEQSEEVKQGSSAVQVQETEAKQDGIEGSAGQVQETGAKQGSNAVQVQEIEAKQDGIEKKDANEAKRASDIDAPLSNKVAKR